jgi:hypothetical protein
LLPHSWRFAAALPGWSLPLSIARVWALVLVAPLFLLMFIGTQLAGVRRDQAPFEIGELVVARGRS